MTNIDTADGITLTITLRPHQAAALKELFARYPLVDREEVFRLVLNVGLNALPRDEDAVLCLDVGDALATERAD